MEYQTGKAIEELTERIEELEARQDIISQELDIDWQQIVQQQKQQGEQ